MSVPLREKTHSHTQKVNIARKKKSQNFRSLDITKFPSIKKLVTRTNIYFFTFFLYLISVTARVPEGPQKRERTGKKKRRAERADTRQPRFTCSNARMRRVKEAGGEA